MLDAFLQVRNLQHHEAAGNLFVEKDGCAVNDELVYLFQASRLEWMFWDSAYHDRPWPITFDGKITK
jgi:hypothetical protein